MGVDDSPLPVPVCQAQLERQPRAGRGLRFVMCYTPENRAVRLVADHGSADAESAFADAAERLPDAKRQRT